MLHRKITQCKRYLAAVSGRRGGGVWRQQQPEFWQLLRHAQERLPKLEAGRQTRRQGWNHRLEPSRDCMRDLAPRFVERYRSARVSPIGFSHSYLFFGTGISRCMTQWMPGSSAALYPACQSVAARRRAQELCGFGPKLAQVGARNCKVRGGTRRLGLFRKETTAAEARGAVAHPRSGRIEMAATAASVSAAGSAPCILEDPIP